MCFCWPHKQWDFKFMFRSSSSWLAFTVKDLKLKHVCNRLFDHVAPSTSHNGCTLLSHKIFSSQLIAQLVIMLFKCIDLAFVMCNLSTAHITSVRLCSNVQLICVSLSPLWQTVFSPCCMLIIYYSQIILNQAGYLSTWVVRQTVVLSGLHHGIVSRINHTLTHIV